MDKKQASNDADASEAVDFINSVIDQQARQKSAAADVSQANSANNLVGGTKRGSNWRRNRVRREGETDISNEEGQAYPKPKTASEKRATRNFTWRSIKQRRKSLGTNLCVSLEDGSKTSATTAGSRIS